MIGIEKINWLPVNISKFFKETCALYFHDISMQFGQNQANIRFVLKLKHLLKTCILVKKVCPI